MVNGSLNRVTLCDSFRSLAFQTWRMLAQSRVVNHQPLEETITDLNILSLKISNPTEIFTKIFTKPQEGINGADWEWWFLDAASKTGFPIRIQAKILDLETDSFPHLHYKNRKTGIYQHEKLERDAHAHGILPLYCFYLHCSHDQRGASLINERNFCGSFAYAPESFGCSLAPVRHIKGMQAINSTDLQTVLAQSMPWHCLVCCQSYSRGSLPDRVSATLRNRSFGSDNLQVNNLRVRDQLPAYVRAVMSGDLVEPPDEALRAITVIRESV